MAVLVAVMPTDSGPVPGLQPVGVHPIRGWAQEFELFTLA